jgi:hypothetical protein
MASPVVVQPSTRNDQIDSSRSHNIDTTSNSGGAIETEFELAQGQNITSGQAGGEAPQQEQHVLRIYHEDGGPAPAGIVSPGEDVQLDPIVEEFPPPYDEGWRG